MIEGMNGMMMSGMALMWLLAMLCSSLGRWRSSSTFSREAVDD